MESCDEGPAEFFAAASAGLPGGRPHDRWMRLALDEARAAAAEDEVPVGAIVVAGGRVIASAHTCNWSNAARLSAGLMRCNSAFTAFCKSAGNVSESAAPSENIRLRPILQAYLFLSCAT